MAALVTGGAGFIGLAVAEALLSAGEEVVLFDHRPPREPLAARLPSDRLRLVTGDVRSASDLAGALGSAGVDRVLHAAAITPAVERERTEPEHIVSVNVGGTATVLRAAKEHGSVDRVVVLSSVAVYGFAAPGAEGAYGEAHSCPAPVSLYGVTKLASEQTALRLGDLYDLDVRAVRLGPVYGPWEHPSGERDAMSPHLQVIEQALTGAPIVLPRPCAADWLYARDAGQGLRRLLFASSLRHPVYNLGGGAISDLPGWCGALAGVLPDVAWQMARQDETATVRYALEKDRAPLDNRRIANDIAFSPAFNGDAAARDFVAWYRQTYPAV